jgi:hypothetical protein
MVEAPCCDKLPEMISPGLRSWYQRVMSTTAKQFPDLNEIAMKKRALGKSDLSITPIGFGAWRRRMGVRLGIAGRFGFSECHPPYRFTGRQLD